jgi:hypothetical protein
MALENSETTITSPQSGILSEPEQKSRRKVNAREARKAEQLQRRIERLRNRFLCDVRVTSVSWARNNSIAKEQALRPINILRGVLVPADEEQDFTVQVKMRKKDCEQLLVGHPTGKKTTLSVSETMAYFILPDSDLGIQVGRNAEFPSNPLRLKTADETTQNKDSSDSIDIGYILDDRDNPVEKLRLPKDSLATSVGIFGDIGSGKTTTVLTALYELSEKGIPFLVLCPSKNEEYRHFIRLKPTTRIFTPADETTAPFRFNPHRFSKGVLVNSVISNVKAAYIAALPNIGMIKEYLEAAIDQTFERMGWNRDTNKHGEPLLLSDFLDTLPHIDLHELDYSDRLNQDFKGALNGRFRSLQRGPLSRIFNTLIGITIEELVSHPTIILMEGLSDEEKSLLSALLIVNIAQYFESLKKTTSASKGLKHVIVIEEAHNLLTGSSKSENSDEGHASVQYAINTILRSIREGRSSGLGFKIIDQLPKELADAAVAIPKTVIVHNMSSIQDRDKVCSQINCSESQIRKVGALPVGQAVVKLPDRAEPVRANITPLTKKFPELDDLFITNTELKNHMKRVYEKWPVFKEGVPQTVISSGLDPRVCARILRLANHELFGRAITEAIGVAKNGNSTILALSLIEFAKKGAREISMIPFYCEYLIWILKKRDFLQDTTVLPALYKEMKTQIKRLFEIDWAQLDVSEEQFKQATEIASRYIETALDENEQEIKKEIEDLFRAAINERNRQRDEPSVDIEMKEERIDPEIDAFIQSVVETDQFARFYFDRLRKAANGETVPIVNMMVGFSKRIDTEPSLLQAVARRFLECSREILGAPEDNELWTLIVTQVEEALAV